MFVHLEKDEIPNKHNIEDPWFVLHIGPPKTATTTIQCGLEKHSLRLAKTDGYHYLGGGCGSEGRMYYMPNGEATVLRRQILEGLYQPDPQHKTKEHLKEFVERAKYLRNKGRSVILSSELFGSRMPANAKMMWKLQKSIFSKKRAGFSTQKVKIVLAALTFKPCYKKYRFKLLPHMYSHISILWVSTRNCLPSVFERETKRKACH